MEGNSVERLLDEARQGESESLGQLLQVYRNYLTILATTQLDRRLRRRMNPSDLVQETMLAAHCDFAKFRGSTEREFLAWLRQILINCLHHAIETHLNARMRDVRREISVEQVSAALDWSVVHFAQVLADRGPSPNRCTAPIPLSAQVFRPKAALSRSEAIRRRSVTGRSTCCWPHPDNR
jgi:RNA polymerase sigma-70 factor (ECF subfamily)